MDRIPTEIADLFEAKEARRRRLAGLPIEEKVLIVIELQKIAAPVLQSRGIKTRVWVLPGARAIDRFDLK